MFRMFAAATLLSALLLALFTPPAQADPLVVSSKTYRSHASVSGTGDGYTRCMQALQLAKSLLPEPKPFQRAAYRIVSLDERADIRRCTAEVEVTITFRFPSKRPSHPSVTSPSFRLPPETSLLQR
ncbi:MAG: hypothetical protein D6690_14655 [Nitrospirae bacterium]|nr:MAG: hypothetical protein D6690_14655 [Nitrospirota bacterium]